MITSRIAYQQRRTKRGNEAYGRTFRVVMKVLFLVVHYVANDIGSRGSASLTAWLYVVHLSSSKLSCRFLSVMNERLIYDLWVG